jgi:hypothetical protein
MGIFDAKGLVMDRMWNELRARLGERIDVAVDQPASYAVALS